MAFFYLTHSTHLCYNEVMKYPTKESDTVELKREMPCSDQIIKTMIGFCNKNGGKIIIGISNDGRIIGLDDAEIEKILESIDKAVYSAATPPILPRAYTQRIDNKSIVIIEVAAGMNKPYYRKLEGLTKGTYVRLGRNTIRATQDMIDELKWQSIGLDFEDLPVYNCNKDELNLDKIQEFLNHRINHSKAKLNDHLLNIYHLITNEHADYHPTVAGILLFGKRPQYYFSEAMIICTHFEGTSGRTAIATVDCEGTLFEQFHQAQAFVLSRLYRSFKIAGMRRDEKLEIPEVALREALLNAVIHRNYHIKGPTKIAIYDDRIEIFSPGHFPGPIRSNDLLLGVTYLRNPTICKIFRESGLVEKLGTGLIAIFSSYKEWGLTTPQVIEGDNYIKCILPRTALKTPKENKDESDLILGMFDSASEITVQGVVRELGLSRATASRRLKGLVDSGKIIRIGKTRSLRYRRA